MGPEVSGFAVELWKEDLDFPTGNHVAETAETQEEIQGCQNLQFLF